MSYATLNEDCLNRPGKKKTTVRSGDKQNKKYDTKRVRSESTDEDSTELCHYQIVGKYRSFIPSDAKYVIVEGPVPQPVEISANFKLQQLADLYQNRTFHFEELTFNPFSSSFIDICKRAENTKVTNVIDFISRMNLFTEFDAEDRLSLLKGGWPDLCLLVDIFNTNETGNFIYLRDKKGQKIDYAWNEMKEGGFLREYEDCKRMIKVFPLHLRKDILLITAICGILLFHPDRPKLKNRQLVWKYQEYFYWLLRQHLLSKMKTRIDVQMSFLAIVGYIANLRSISHRVIVNPLTQAGSEELRTYSPVILDLLNDELIFNDA